jgi:methionyl-tRNA formyltransferase
MKAMRLRIVFLGTADFAVPTLEALAKGPDDIATVVTRPDRPAGRGRKLRPPQVKAAAEGLGLRILQPERISRPPGPELLRGLSPDLLLVAAYGEILSREVLSLPRLGAVNLHASLLPHYRGAAPIQRALLAGERETGVTVQWMAEELDAGDIILQRALPVGEEESLGSLHDRLAALGAEAVGEAMDLIRKGEAPRVPQDAEHATFAPPIKLEELAIDWRRPASGIARQIRAFSPRPGARTSRGKTLLKLLVAREEGGGAREGVPGRVAEISVEGFCVEAGERRLWVLRVQPAGGRAMSATDYVRGHRLLRGEVLGAAGTSSEPDSS